jgi:hypothetical protein
MRLSGARTRGSHTLACLARGTRTLASLAAGLSGLEAPLSPLSAPGSLGSAALVPHGLSIESNYLTSCEVMSIVIMNPFVPLYSNGLAPRR